MIFRRELAFECILLLCWSIKWTNAGNFDEKPKFLKTCRLAGPDFIKCSTDSIQGLFKELITGIDGLVDVETIDPMKINRIKILQGDGPVSVNASLTKVTVTGFDKCKIVKNIVDKKDFHWETQIFLPKMRIEANYNMKGRILVIPLNGRGKCVFEPSNMDIKLYTTTHLYDKDDHVYYNVTATKVDYTLNGIKIRMDNLFDGIKVLEESTNRYLNENWEPVSEALKPIIASTISDILLDMMQKIFHQIPGDYFVEDLPKGGT